MRNGARRIPAITVRVTIKVRKVKMQERNSRFFSRSFSRRYSLKVGMKAAETEPSAKRRRNRFGSMKATEKASERALVPRRLAFVISRNRPRILETSVKSDRIEPWRSREAGDARCWFLSPINATLWHLALLDNPLLF